MFNFLKNCQTVFQSSSILHSHQQWMRVPVPPHFCQHVALQVILMLPISPKTHDLSMCCFGFFFSFIIHITSLVRHLNLLPTFCFILLSCKRYLHILGISPLQSYVFQIFSSYLWLVFSLMVLNFKFRLSLIKSTFLWIMLLVFYLKMCS